MTYENCQQSHLTLLQPFGETSFYPVLGYLVNRKKQNDLRICFALVTYYKVNYDQTNWKLISD